MSHSKRIAVVVAAALAGVMSAVASCGGPRPAAVALSPFDAFSGSTSPASLTAQLPSPAAIKPRQTSTLVDILNGTDCDPVTAHNVVPFGEQAAYNANSTPADTDPSGLAYGIYEFVPDKVNDAPLLHLAWATPPPAGATWVALANFTANHWDWQRWQAGHDIPVDFGSKNMNNQGRVLAVVLVAGSGGNGMLARLRIGANQPPQVVLAAEHANQPVPFQLKINALGCDDPDGVVSRLDFDYDNDGTFDFTSFSDKQGFDNVLVDGSFVCRVRVTDDDGAQTEGTVAWDTGYSQTWAPFNDLGPAEFYGVCAIPGGGFYATGGTETAPGGNWHVLLARFNADGSAQWARSLASPNGDFGRRVVLAPDGGAYVAGCYNLAAVNVIDAVIARYAPDGTLDWQRTWGGGNNSQDYYLAADNTNNRVYLATTLIQQITGQDAGLLCFEADGTWDWTRMWGAVDQEESRGIGVAQDGSVLWGCLSAIGSEYGGTLFHLSAAGDQLSKLRYTQAGTYVQPEDLAVRSDGVIALAGSVSDIQDNNSGAFCLTLDAALQPRWARQLINQTGDKSEDADFVTFGPDGRIWMTGGVADTGANRGGLLLSLADDGTPGKIGRSGPDAVYNTLFGLCFNPDSSLELAGFVAAPGNTGFTYLQRTATDMQLTYTIPAQNIYTDLTAPVATAGASGNLQSLPAPDQGGILYKYYEPAL